MTPVRWFIFGFWAFVIVMLLWQAYSFEMNSEKEIAAKGPPKHYFFDPKMDNASTPGTAAPANPSLRAADVVQDNYWTTIHRDIGTFDAHSVLKNRGNAKAVGIQLWIRPYRGVAMGDDGGKPYLLPENDPLSQFGQWVSTPDLAPGESCTQTVTFIIRPSVNPGGNPHPQIIFATEKTNAP